MKMSLAQKSLRIFKLTKYEFTVGLSQVVIPSAHHKGSTFEHPDYPIHFFVLSNTFSCLFCTIRNQCIDVRLTWCEAAAADIAAADGDRGDEA